MSTVVSTEARIREVQVSDDSITAHLVDGRVISVPLAWSWRLSEATAAQRGNFRIIGDGQGVHWPDVDEDISAEGMLHGVPARRPSRRVPRTSGAAAPTNNGGQLGGERVDRVAQRLAQYSWPYADQDPDALAEIARRVAETGRHEKLITYTELVSGIDFRIPTVDQGRPLRLGVPEWTDLHRAIIGNFLGRLCVDTYSAGGFMGSALVVAADTRQPSEGYREFMKQLGLLRGNSESEFLAHWIPETRKAYAWYGRHS